jgi:3-hydroxyisobutyrate dehydrogenase
MAANLVKAGHRVRGYDLSPASLKAAADAGVEPAASATEAVAGTDVVITMLPAGRHVLELYQDIVGAARPGTLFADCSTIDVADARTAHDRAVSAGMRALDAPVSGGVVGAEAATLTFMAAAARTSTPRPNPCSPPWAGRWSTAAARAPDRPRRSATT